MPHQRVLTRAVFFKSLFLITSLSLGAYASAEDLLAMPDPGVWHRVMSVGVGVAHTNEVGVSQSFPKINTLADIPYTYTPDSSSQNALLADFFVGAERAIAPNWSIQVGGDFNQISTFTGQGTVLQGDPGNTSTFGYNYTVLTRQILEENKLLYTIDERYHPYFSFGAGVGFNEAYDFSTSATTPARLFADQTTTAFTYRLGAGVDVDMSRHVRLGLGYRFSDLGKVSLGNSSIQNGNAGATSNGTLSQDHMYTNDVLAQFIYVI